ncbi:hypothetical protein PS645_01907 [Pseudomonas fluorescens]|uniref:Uncharacterized protein n=1 Tax=Pseudomonas fluorescens TaxID=294 RepID=A0A5E6S1D7_PSEFL|nr:hypothetical protein [Pseudomonas fluorescens]VVM73902.1 hypothetical protein PS645_01907 [Pseudomonas fluorescens]
MKKFTWGLGLCLATTLPAVDAANQEIRAEFRLDPSRPGKNEFINTTPNSGYCADWPNQCIENKIFSIQMPVRFTSSRALEPGRGVSLKVPADWRQTRVTNPVTQESALVEVRIIGAGSRFVLSDTASKLTGAATDAQGHVKLWEGADWVNPASPCQYSGVGAWTSKTYRFFWKTPLEAYCTKVNAYEIPGIEFNSLDIAYELRTPNPLKLSTGLYTGSIPFMVGYRGDFDLGPLMQADDGWLYMNFVLDVVHTLKVDLPPGGNKVMLEPEGGWASWINSGRKPTKIYRDQPFYISASSRFKVMMLCNSTGGSRCKLYSPKGNVTDVETYLTLPHGISGPGGPGSNVTLHPLRHSVWAGPFEPSLYVDRKAGSLRFDMPKDAIDFLLKPGLSDTLSGNITIIWDSEV